MQCCRPPAARGMMICKILQEDAECDKWELNRGGLCHQWSNIC